MSTFKLAPVDLLLLQLKENGFPLPEREHKFHPTRKWRFDLAWTELQFFTQPTRFNAWEKLASVAIEVDGGARLIRTGPKGTMIGGRHASAGDIEKLNTATALGWRVFRFTNRMVENGNAIKFLKSVL